MEIMIDGQKINNRRQLYQALREQMQLPAYFGNNLDALYDVLTEYSMSLKILIWNEDILKQKLGDYAEQLLKMLQDAAATNRKIILVKGDRINADDTGDGIGN